MKSVALSTTRHDEIPLPELRRRALARIADHGYTGAAIRAGIQVISVMDTNDPALAVWKYARADVTIIPIDDNRPFNAYEPVVDLVHAFGTMALPPGADIPLR